MTNASRQESPELEAIKQEIRDEQGEATDAPSGTAHEEEQVTPEEFENDPAHNPDDDALKNVKGG